MPLKFHIFFALCLTIFTFFKSSCDAVPADPTVGIHAAVFMLKDEGEESSSSESTPTEATTPTTTSLSGNANCDEKSLTDTFTMKFNLDSSSSATSVITPKLSAGIAIKVTGGSVQVKLGFCESEDPSVTVLDSSSNANEVCKNSDELKDIQTQSSCKQKAEKLSIGDSSQPLYVMVSGYSSGKSTGSVTIKYDASLSLPITKNMLPWWGWLIVGIAILIVIVVVFLKFGLECAKGLCEKISPNMKLPQFIQNFFSKSPKPATA